MAQSVQRKNMLWYYDSIIDWMLANPGRPLSECAKYIGRTQTTLSIIINSDIFKAHLAARKSRFQAQHDLGIIQKNTQIANAGLDAILAAVEKKKDAIPLETLQEVTGSALDRLGYGTKPQSGGITVNATGNTQVVLPVSSDDLNEARNALRAAQQQRSYVPPTSPTVDVLLEGQEAEPVKVIEGGAVAPVIPSD